MTTQDPFCKAMRGQPSGEFWATLGITIVMVAIFLSSKRFGYHPNTVILLALLVAAPFLIQYDRRWKRKQAEAISERLIDWVPIPPKGNGAE